MTDAAPPDRPEGPASGPVVSVVIPTRDSAGGLGRSIASVRRVGSIAVEIIVVDGGSADATASIAAATGASFVRGPYPRATARRIGAERSSAPYLLFLDSDQTVEAGLVEECVNLALQHGWDAVKIPERDEQWGSFAGSRALDRRLAGGDALAYPRFFAHAAYDAIGGHRPGLEDFMEDRALFLRFEGSRRPWGWSRRSITNHLGRVNPIDLGRRGARSAHDAAAFLGPGRLAGASLRSVVRPRLEALANGAAGQSAGVGTWLAFPVYVLAVYGPRLLTAASRR